MGYDTLPPWGGSNCIDDLKFPYPFKNYTLLVITRNNNSTSRTWRKGEMWKSLWKYLALFSRVKEDCIAQFARCTLTCGQVTLSTFIIHSTCFWGVSSLLHSGFYHLNLKPHRVAGKKGAPMLTQFADEKARKMRWECFSWVFLIKL